MLGVSNNGTDAHLVCHKHTQWEVYAHTCQPHKSLAGQASRSSLNPGLGTVWSVACMCAHIDDADGVTAAWLVAHVRAS